MVFLLKFDANIRQLFELMNFTGKYYTEIGWLEIKGDENFIHSILFREEEPEISDELPQHFIQLNEQFDDYFQHKKWTFDVPLKPKGTDFQVRVWNELQKIPFGKTISYLKLAQDLGDEKTIRAAASANGKNPISIIIPCHRVIGKDGSLTGYAGGLHRKKYLLELEKGIKTMELF